MQLKTRAGWRITLVKEIRRKLIHLTGLTVPAGILLLGQLVTAVLVGLAMSIALVLEVLRLRGRISLPEVREGEADRVASYVYYILGSLLAVLIFNPMVAITAMLMLSLGDTASGIMGSVIQNSDVRDLDRGRRVKPIPVVLGMFVTCLFIGYLSSVVTHLPLIVYLAGAAGATIADSVPIFLGKKVVDDNLTIPICSGAMMSVVRLLI